MILVHHVHQVNAPSPPSLRSRVASAAPYATLLACPFGIALDARHSAREGGTGLESRTDEKHLSR